MKPETKIRKLEKQLHQIRHDLEYEYDYWRVKDLRDEAERRSAEEARVRTERRRLEEERRRSQRALGTE